MVYRDRKPMTRGKRGVAAAILVLVGVLMVGGCANMLRYTAGWSGTPGTFRLLSCETVGSGKGQHTECSGLYRSDDRRTTDPDAVMSHAYAPGTVVAVERAGTGTYYPTGFGPDAGALAGISFGLLFLSVAGLACVQLSRRYPSATPGGRPRAAELPRPLGSLTRFFSFVGLGGLGAFVFFLIAALATNGI
ncbi:hypothetical protein DN069_00775 [Streptacidiphilus pinicola]|uniref:DUF3592 domain-containing protein n=1 Tax=Streptacidiphilus pinicola TaxID=2219663 RepID=A0A2X0JIK6_9ACTN|nr:hypothetical protein [Streptacidiphilus pinicola]RAG87558.1 hypothetical protein DN069_00775 [Streptacidiphilus pinicola]